MSDDIRIYGGGGRQHEGDPRKRRAAALQRFKRGHKSGDMVRGIFLNLEPASPGTAWVSLEGAALLAALPDNLAQTARLIAAGQGAGATPTGVREADFPIKRGQTCHFLLESLEPEPVLRMLGVADGEAGALAKAAAEARWQGILRMPLTQLAARYTQKRMLLDGLLQQKLWTAEDRNSQFPQELPLNLTDFSAIAFAEETCPQSPQARYTAFIKGEDEIKRNFDEMEIYRAALLENLRLYGLLGFFFVPWLCPASRGLELAFYRHRAPEAASPDRASAMQGVTYKLQGTLEDGARQKRLELSGFLGGSKVLRVSGPDDPDLLRVILAFRPEETRTAFSRKA